MLRVIHPNRWFFWTIATLLAFGLFLIWSVQRANQEFEAQETDLVSSAAPIWRNYRSAIFGITVRYPAAWQIELGEESNVVTLENPLNFNDNITISVIEPKFETVIRNSLPHLKRTEQGIVIDGVKGTWLKSTSSDKATENVIFVKARGKEYYIAGSAKQFYKIVTGIKFI